MLQKAKQEISKRDKRIKQLEYTIKQGGSQVPESSEIFEE